MALIFHRLNAYPAGYNFGYGANTFDFINNPPANTPPDPGVPALFDTKLSGGPNQGSYFVGFGEDALSPAVNRIAEALARNTDTLDDYMHRPLATAKETAIVAAVGPIASVLLPDAQDVYLGTPGMPFPDTLARIFRVLDFQDKEIIDPVTGAVVTVTSLVGGALFGGFSAGPITVNVTPSIPNGTIYKVRYGTKTNEAVVPENALLMGLLQATGASGEIENLFRRLRSPVAINEVWNAIPFKSTIWDLAHGGLNERYRRSTTSPLTPIFDTPGAGATITRDGIAPRSLSTLSTRVHPDELNAGWTAQLSDQTAGKNTTYGSIGFVSVGARWAVKGESGVASALGSFVSLFGHGDVTNTAPVGDGYYTRLGSGTNVTSVQDANGWTVTSTAPATDYFRKLGKTGITKLKDVFLLQDPISGAHAMCVCDNIISDTSIHLRLLDNGISIGGLAGAMVLTWYSTLFFVGNGAGPANDALQSPGTVTANAAKLDGLYCVRPALYVDPEAYPSDYAAFTGDPLEAMAYFGAGLARSNTDDLTGVGNNHIVLGVGGFDRTTGTNVVGFQVNSAGGALGRQMTRNSIRRLLVTTDVNPVDLTNLLREDSLINVIAMVPGLEPPGISFNTALLPEGYEFDICIYHNPSTLGTLLLTPALWPTEAHFENYLDAFTSNKDGYLDHYHGVIVGDDVGLGKLAFMTVTRLSIR